MSEKNIKSTKSIELLAPAGDLSAGIAAIDSGADAIYCGLKKFSARDRAENFSFEDLARILSYAHEKGKYVYVAFNTLVKESEICEAAKMIAKIAELGADGIIVQDLGIVRIVRDYFSFLPLHASTQLAIHNSAGANFAKRLGFRRVILERQLLLSEIKTIVEKSSVEIEIFVHGALCCSLSGQCLLSSWLGGYSGNRGKCKQACRFPSYFEKGKYPLSTRDLCLAERILELKSLGISAFKIEGRLKAIDYVINVVKAYRMLLDADEKEFQFALNEAKNLLKISSTRKYVNGFERDFKNLINPNEAGSIGIMCGKVIKVLGNGFVAHVSGKLHLGDKIRVQRVDGSSAVSLTVKKILLNNREVNSVSHQEVFLESDRSVEVNDLIFKIGESVSLRNSQLMNLKMISAEKFDLHIMVNEFGFSVFLKNFGKKWEHPYKLAVAAKHPLDIETVKKIFSETADNRFKVQSIEVQIDGKYFIPLSELKEIRRSFWKFVEKVYLDREQEKKERIKKILERFERDLSNFKSCFGNVIDSISKCEETICGRGNSVCKDTQIKAYELRDEKLASVNDEIILPYFCPESELEKLRLKIDDLVRKGFRRFRARSLAHFDILTGYNNLAITAAFPLQCANSVAFCEFRSFGARKVQLWVELERKEIEKLLEKFSYSAEIFEEGVLPLFFTRGNLSTDVCEIKGKIIHVTKIQHDVKILFSEKKLKFPHLKNASIFRDLHFCEIVKGESNFNFEREWR